MDVVAAKSMYLAAELVGSRAGARRRRQPRPSKGRRGPGPGPTHQGKPGGQAQSCWALWGACLAPSSHLCCYVQALRSCGPAQEQRHFLELTVRLPATSLHWQLAQAALRPGSGSPALQEQGRGREAPPAGVLTLRAASSEQGPDEQAPHRLGVSLPARSRGQWASATPQL